MSIVDFEVEEILKLCENVVPCSKVIACNSTLVRVDIKFIDSNRQLTVCLRFPSHYPHDTILVELKSRTLCTEFLKRFSNLCEVTAKEHLGRPQCMIVLKFVETYLRENPLCVVLDEILELRKLFQTGEGGEHLKLCQNSSTVKLLAKGGLYYYSVKATVPNDYPKHCIGLKRLDTNLPDVLVRYLDGQSKEIARRCVEPPLSTAKSREAATFQVIPSLYKALRFCLEATRDFATDLCPICEESVLPKHPDDLTLDDNNSKFVERVFCGHLYHQGCLRRYIHTPPFSKSGKPCPARKCHPRSDVHYDIRDMYTIHRTPTQATAAPADGSCGIALAHDRWVINPKIAEARWAQKQARERELQEIIDFLQ